MNLSQPVSPQIIYLNGAFLHVQEASISPFDRGFLYGDGLFETMRAEEGHILYWLEHRERLYKTAAALNITVGPSLPWEHLLTELLLRNDLLKGVARVKIILTRGIALELGLPPSTCPTLCLMAQRYKAPHSDIYQKGWRLRLFQDGFSPPLARFKSLNYLYFLMAKQAAANAGADEALILDPRGNVAETATGSILAKTDGRWWTPVSHYQLPGITLRQVVSLIQESGQEVKSRLAPLKDLYSAETVWVLNSLLGIMPVSHLEDHSFLDLSTQEAAYFRKVLFEKGKSENSEVDTHF
jgi:branched-chain amino acid aminotransferase/para-aminobenzoate synthetase component 1